MVQPTVADVSVARGLTARNIEPALRALLRQLADWLATRDLSFEDLLSDLQKPYPAEHAARQHDPSRYKAIRRQNDKFGAGIDVLFGILPDGKTEVQAIRFDASKFTPEQARAWLAAHKYKTALEVATGKEDMQKARNVLDYLISEVHRSFTVCADTIFGNGDISQEERIALSAAIGDALDAFNAFITKNNLEHLRSVNFYIGEVAKGDSMYCNLCGAETEELLTLAVCKNCLSASEDEDESELTEKAAADCSHCGKIMKSSALVKDSVTGDFVCQACLSSNF